MAANRFHDAAEILEVLVKREREAGQPVVWANVLAHLGYCRFRIGEYQKAKELSSELLGYELAELKVSPATLKDHEQALNRSRAKQILGAAMIELGERLEGRQYLIDGGQEFWQRRNMLRPHLKYRLIDVIERMIQYEMSHDTENAALWRRRFRGAIWTNELIPEKSVHLGRISPF